MIDNILLVIAVIFTIVVSIVVFTIFFLPLLALAVIEQLIYNPMGAIGLFLLYLAYRSV